VITAGVTVFGVGLVVVGGLATTGCSNNAPPPAPKAAPVVTAPAEVSPVAASPAAPASQPAAKAPAAGGEKAGTEKAGTEQAAMKPLEKAAESVTNKPGVKPADTAASAKAASEKAAGEKMAEQRPAAAPATPSLEALLADLAVARDEDARVPVIDAIASLGQNAKPALAELVKYCGDKDVRTRWHAARAVGLIGEDAISALPVLVGLLGDVDPIVATQAAAAIGLIRADDGRRTEALPAADAAAYDAATKALIQVTVHPDPRVRRASLRAIGTLKPPLDVLGPLFTKQLADADPSVVLPAVRSLADLGGRAVPLLVESLKNPKSRYWSAIALAEIGPEAAPAVEVLTEQLASGDTHECVQAMIALGAIGKGAQPAVDDLVRELDSRDPSRRLGAAFALGRIGDPSAKEPLVRLAAASDADPFMKSIAQWAGVKIEPRDIAARDAAGVRSGSVSALSDLAPTLDDAAAATLAEKFVELLADPDDDTRVQAATSLVRLGRRGAGPLAAAIEDPDRRLFAMELLAAIGPDAAPALDRLATVLEAGDPAAAGEAALAIAAIGPPAARLVPALDKLLSSPAGGDSAAGKQQRYAVAYALGRIGAEAKPALERLQVLGTSDDEMLATVATWSALKIGPADASFGQSAVPVLRKALRSHVELVRVEAAAALGDLGAVAQSAVPILELVAEDDPAPTVRAAAADALAKIRGG
jgi:HEAT repeat protein